MCLKTFCLSWRLKLSFLFIACLSLQPHLENECRKKRENILSPSVTVKRASTFTLYSLRNLSFAPKRQSWEGKGGESGGERRVKGGRGKKGRGGRGREAGMVGGRKGKGERTWVLGSRNDQSIFKILIIQDVYVVALWVSLSSHTFSKGTAQTGASCLLGGNACHTEDAILISFIRIVIIA